MVVITGATGKIGKRIAELCKETDINVLALSNNSEKLENLKMIDADIAIGDLNDYDFLENSFQNSEYVILNFPIVSKFYRKANNRRLLANKYFEVINKLAVPNVIVLSCITAELGEGDSSLYDFNYIENLFKKYDKGNVLILRSCFFMENIFAQIPFIKLIKTIAVPIDPIIKIPFVAKHDFARIAFEIIKNKSMEQGYNVEYVCGAHNISYSEITALIGNALNLPKLNFFQATFEISNTYIFEKDHIYSDDIENQITIFELITNGDFVLPLNPRNNFQYDLPFNIFANEFASKYNAFINNIATV